MQKFECVAHVQKRMGKRLCDLKKNAKGRTLADGKSIGGRGKLTDMEINKIQAYYCNAIRGNINNLVGMRSAVWAFFLIFFSSTNCQLMRSRATIFVSETGALINRQRPQEHCRHLTIQTICLRQSWRRSDPSSRI